MTIEELNALYEATDFGNLGNYKAPTTTSNIDLTAPVVEGIPAIQPYTPPFIPIEGEGRPTDTPIDPMSFGNLGIKGYNQMNISGPVKNSFTDIIGDLYSAYTNISPVNLGIKGIKKVTDFVKEKQRVAAENQRLADEINAREQKRQIAIIQDRIDNDPRSAPPGAPNNPYHGGAGGVQSGIGQSSSQAGADAAQADDSAGHGGYNKGGRIRYGKGGIITL
jgi:hypothetical protein|tara:strand:- start:35 stop:697 length:663 start_codon:yes stop_codon:yes gene_type:complete